MNNDLGEVCHDKPVCIHVQKMQQDRKVESGSG